MDMSRETISIIIPALNEEKNLPLTITSVQAAHGIEIIVVDGGSSDCTMEVARSLGVKTLCTRPGRAVQMNRGAGVAQGDLFFFLHADTLLPVGYDRCIRRTLQRNSVVAGAFKLAIRAPGASLRFIEYGANIRSKYLGLPYGDQGLFMRRRDFNRVGGFPEIALMEDFALVRKMKKFGQVAVAPLAVETSARRWQQRGVSLTTLMNQLIVAAYLLGVSPERLAGWYRGKK